MPTYYFNLKKCHDPDFSELSREHPDLQTTLADAQGMARMVERRLRQQGLRDLHGSLDIEDECGSPVARILLSDLIRHVS